MNPSSLFPLGLLRSLTALNGLAAALILAAALVFGREWPLALSMFLQSIAGAAS